MQECRKKITGDKIKSRGTEDSGIFYCYCTETVDSNCQIQINNLYPQYLVYKYSSSDTSSERLYAPYDKQTGFIDSKQCKCPGFYLKKGQAFSCPKDTYSGSGPCASKCKKCPLGRFSEIGSAQCSKCPAGTILKDNLCNKCAQGQYATASDTECGTCPIGRFTLSEGSGFCKACPQGYQDNDPSEGLLCVPCAKGKSSLEGAVTCTDCPKGYYQTETGKHVCSECQEGKYDTEIAKDDSSCKLCGPGYYQDQKHQINCKYCRPGKYQNSNGRSQCLNCQSGRYTNTNTRTVCTLCPRTTYQNQVGKTGCKGCGTGQYQPYTGQSSCYSCYKGQYRYSSRYGCKNCPTGYYQDEDKKNSCKNCGNRWDGYSWSNSPDRKTFSGSCDSYKTNLPSEHDMYWSHSYDCKYNMAGRTSGKGDMWRRKCWTGDTTDGTRCKHFARDNHDDDSMAWTEGHIDGGYKWCIPPTSNQASD